MSIEKPNNWIPPSKDYEGEDIVNYFALLFLDQTVAMMYAKTKNLNLPILSEFQSFLDQENAVCKRLNDREKYFYKKGSIFMDYKIMREESSNNVELQLLKKQFNPNMSAHEAFELAKTIVSNWNWQKTN